MSIRFKTSRIEPEETANKMLQLLATNGARNVSLDFDKAGDVQSITFAMEISDRMLNFRLSPDPAGMLKAMKADSDVRGSYCNPTQARRTAWRSELAWLEATLNRVACNQARLEQLLLGYATTGDGSVTLYEHLLDNASHLLPAES